MNIVFVGSSNFGWKCLSACFEMSEVTVTGVITSPQTFSISYRPSGVTNVLHADVCSLANSHGVPVLKIKNSMNDAALLSEVSKWKPNAFLVAGWYHMVPKSWRQLAPAYGLHASLLPDYSGGAPLVWAMINGETKTGITLFQMDDGVDSGPIAAQSEEYIAPDDTIATLYARIEESGLNLLREALPMLVHGTLLLKSQDKSKQRILPQRAPEDGLIDWTKDSISIDRFVRAQTRPYPGAFTIFKGKPLHIWRAQQTMCMDESLLPGYVYRSEENSACVVVCGAGAITIKEITYEQKIYRSSEIHGILSGGGQVLGA